MGKNNNQKHPLPAILALLPGLGLGQWLKGHFKKGLFIWLVSFITTVVYKEESIWMTFDDVQANTIIEVVFFCVWIWSIYDAYNAN